MKALIPTNTALTVKQWMELLREEHNYHLPVAQPESPVKSPVKPDTENTSMSSQVRHEKYIMYCEIDFVVFGVTDL